MLYSRIRRLETKLQRGLLNRNVTRIQLSVLIFSKNRFSWALSAKAIFLDYEIVSWITGIASSNQPMIQFTISFAFFLPMQDETKKVPYQLVL